ncbi:hypothetical protein CEXT_200561 [Caerostris extrusa]|uniref:Uncharacterized protein n=1 Tax=Caerostris extrusa TaxID=172846 RepID=A0AAV4MWH0_CAEEX|nr:hypothetical protein CEXT_200561 [Caerostris extrusa]
MPPLLTALCVTTVGLNHCAEGNEKVGGTEQVVKDKPTWLQSKGFFFLSDLKIHHFQSSEWNEKPQKAFFTLPLSSFAADSVVSNSVGLNHFARGVEKGVTGEREE